MDNELKPVQRNVWDRLGKPHNETNNPFLKERNNSFLPVPAATVPPIHPLVTQNLPSAQAHFVSTSLYPEGVFRTTSLCTPMRANGEIVNKLKRQFEQIESHLRASTVSSKSAERVPAKQRLGISLGPPQPLPVGNCFSSNMANEPVLVHTGLKPDMVSNAGSLNSDQRAPIVRNIPIFVSVFLCFCVCLTGNNCTDTNRGQSTGKFRDWEKQPRVSKCKRIFCFFGFYSFLFKYFNIIFSCSIYICVL